MSSTVAPMPRDATRRTELSASSRTSSVAASPLRVYLIPMKQALLPLLLGVLSLPLANCEEQAKAQVPATPMKEKADDNATIPRDHETITLGAGCFWCVEAVYQQLEGVHSATSGYMGGTIPNPTYEQVCSKTTGHVEVVQVKFDPKKLPLEELLSWFWQLHDPTSRDKQGNDVGPQYRSVIFFETPAQKETAQKSLQEAQKGFPKPIVTDLRKAEEFHQAEDIHQDYYFLNKNRNPYCQAVITPKLKKLKLRE